MHRSTSINFPASGMTARETAGCGAFLTNDNAIRRFTETVVWVQEALELPTLEP